MFRPYFVVSQNNGISIKTKDFGISKNFGGIT